MTPFERLAAAYFAALLLAAPWAPRRGRGALYAAASLALVIVAAIALPVPARAWMAHTYLVLGYWVPAAFVVTTHPRFERWLAAADVRLLGTRRISGEIGRGVLELAYLLCYPLVPAGLVVVLANGTHDDVSRFWTAVLAAGFACYVSLPWAAARPPRLVGEERDTLPHVFTALNRGVLGLVSHQRVTFPSGHAAVSLAVALEVSRVAPGFGAAFTVIALLVAAAAVAGRYHYFVDVLAGLVVGLLVPLLVGSGGLGVGSWGLGAGS
jgi:hypothetical protein